MDENPDAELDKLREQDEPPAEPEREIGDPAEEHPPVTCEGYLPELIAQMDR